MNSIPTQRIDFRRFFAALAALCVFAALVLLLPAPALAIDAQKLFNASAESVVVVVNIDNYGNAAKFGTGFFIQDGRLIATNFHVIDQASEIQIKLADGKILKAQSVQAVSRENDIAIIRMDASGKPLNLTEAIPQVGQEIVAIGHPVGLERTVSTGIVSGIRRKDKTTVYQITAPISPGSSGGPVLSAQGEVLGVTTFQAQAGQNLNFAVPSSYIKELLGSGGGSGNFSMVPKTKLEIETGKSGIVIKAKNK